jgi:hypothetical protein
MILATTRVSHLINPIYQQQYMFECQLIGYLALDVIAGREFRLGKAGAGFVAVDEIVVKVVHWALRGLGSHDQLLLFGAWKDYWKVQLGSCLLRLRSR